MRKRGHFLNIHNSDLFIEFLSSGTSFNWKWNSECCGFSKNYTFVTSGSISAGLCWMMISVCPKVTPRSHVKFEYESRNEIIFFCLIISDTIHFTMCTFLLITSHQQREANGKRNLNIKHPLDKYFWFLYFRGTAARLKIFSKTMSSIHLRSPLLLLLLVIVVTPHMRNALLILLPHPALVPVLITIISHFWDRKSQDQQIQMMENTYWRAVPKRVMHINYALRGLCQICLVGRFN